MATRVTDAKRDCSQSILHWDTGVYAEVFDVNIKIAETIQNG